MSKYNLFINPDIINEHENQNQNEISDITALKHSKKQKIKLTKKKKIKKQLKNIYEYWLYISYIFFLYLSMKILIFLYIKQKTLKINGQKFIKPLLIKDSEKEYIDCQEYYYMIHNNLLYDKNKRFYLSDNPKISIVIPVFNGEGYLKGTILSVLNQDFKDIEIIIIDDKSKDKSVELIKEIMKSEPRIRLYQNEINKGELYTKSKGILLSKGKYTMILNDD